MSAMATIPVMDAASRLVARTFEQAAISVPASGNTNTSDLLLQGRFARVTFELDNTVQALDACKVQAQVHPNGDWFDWVTSAELSAGVAIAGRLVIVMTNPTTLAAGSKARFVVDTAGLYGVRLAISAATNSAILAVRGMAVEQASSAAAPSGSGSGDFVGPGSATDNAIVRFNGSTGKLGQNSIWTIDDSGNLQVSGAALVGGGTVEMATGASDMIFTGAVAFTFSIDDGAGGTGGFNTSAGQAYLSAGNEVVNLSGGGSAKGATTTFCNNPGGLRLYDSDSSNYITVRTSSNLASNITLTLVMTASRTLTLSGSATINQSVDTAASPSFAGATLSGAVGLTLSVAGSGILIKESSNATMGVATLSGGTVTVNTTKVTANSRIFLEVQSLGTVAVPTMIGITARAAGTSFTITSANVADTSVIAWVILEPA